MADARVRYLSKVATNVDTQIQQVAAVYAAIPGPLGDDARAAAVTKLRVPSYPRTDLEAEEAATAIVELHGLPIRASKQQVVLRSKRELRGYLTELSLQLQALNGAAAVSQQDFERLLRAQEQALRKQWERAIV